MIIRSPRSRNFTVIGNEMFDRGMSLEAIGMLCYLLSRPDNWRILPAQLAAKFGGRDRTYRILKELVEAFYIARRRLTGGAMEYTVFDVPTSDPEKPDVADPEKPDPEKPDPEKPDVLLTTESNQERIGKSPLKGSAAALRDDWPSDAWEQFWRIFPNKVGKPVAQKKFDLARRRCPSWERFWSGLHRYVNKTDDRPWLNPATFLNQDRWDEAPAPRPGKVGGGQSSFFQEAMGVIGDDGR